jgi:tRNA isopentenyl-2-thiomethyl-A-37 hydroxylase MiaE
VKGTIDGYEIKQFHLMPMGNGVLMLPVKADIRKKIGKKAGDKVHVVLFADNASIEVPAELQQCLDDEPVALKFFNKLSDSEKRYYIQWVYGAKREETRIARLARTINRLMIRCRVFSYSHLYAQWYFP